MRNVLDELMELIDDCMRIEAGEHARHQARLRAWRMQAMRRRTYDGPRFDVRRVIIGRHRRY